MVFFHTSTQRPDHWYCIRRANEILQHGWYAWTVLLRTNQKIHINTLYTYCPRWMKSKRCIMKIRLFGKMNDGIAWNKDIQYTNSMQWMDGKHLITICYLILSVDVENAPRNLCVLVSLRQIRLFSHKDNNLVAMRLYAYATKIDFWPLWLAYHGI